MRSIQKMFRFVWPYLKKYRGQICVYILVGVVFSSLALVQPFILGRFVDRMTGDLQLGTIAVCCAAFFLTAVLNVALSYYMKITGSRLQIRVSTHMKVQLFQHFQRTSPRFHQQKSSGEMAQKINSDAIFLIMFLQDIAMHFPGKLVCFLLATAYVFFVDIWCGLAVLILLPLLFLLYRYFKERVYKAPWPTPRPPQNFSVFSATSFRMFGPSASTPFPTFWPSGFMRAANPPKMPRCMRKRSPFPSTPSTKIWMLS